MAELFPDKVFPSVLLEEFLARFSGGTLVDMRGVFSSFFSAGLDWIKPPDADAENSVDEIPGEALLS